MITFEILDSQKSTEIVEIIENLNTIFTTPEGSVPLDREFGINMDFLDLPISQAQGKFTIEVTRKIKKYEPRVKVKKVIFTNDQLNGRTAAKVVLAFV
jgi:phage baseplate assembly protein W